MTTLDELERAVERLTRAIIRASGAALVDYEDLRALLSERAELLAAVDRMRGALEAFITYVENDATEGVSIMLDYDTAVTKARAALTTGEG